MKRIFYLVCLLMPAVSEAAISMSRVIAIDDSHTITVEANGRRSIVMMKGVDIPPAEEAAAMEYLHRQLDGAWVYAEAGEVYRSPDGLYVNGELQRHAWRAARGMRYLGEADPGPKSRLQMPAAAKRQTVQSQPPPRRVRRQPHSATRG